MASYKGRGTHGQIVELLGGRIVAGGLPEGGTLDLRALGEELDISLSVLRETIKVLTAKGLVDARQKRGTFVRPRSAWNLLDSDVMRWQSAAGDGSRLIRDLNEVRAAIEPAAVRYAALRRGEPDLDRLRRALERMGAADGDARAAAAADLEFHRALLAATGNEMFARMDVLLEPGLLERDLIVHSADHDDPVPSHRAVLDAVAAKDPAAAERAMLALLAKSFADQTRVSADYEDHAGAPAPHAASPPSPGAGGEEPAR
ncbi:DNA-binding FadR family transcriptional regulator [Spinactinospora alkalitolerans]|uniref:DNA-binding FadR family transcriptional regulator n=1 Tax=Spinactinospora alkalitolerans TaxID=687207 RepID=A0A852TVY8_9ACTN|nr:FCD domain-containing protein [Spinactinospora alkalitolerans]NYE48169.1 DNA-binding FadR family transcriptional regulator [Spinactinospora alkalitolerans]